MKQCNRIPLTISLSPSLQIEGAVVSVEGNDFAKLFLKGAGGKELSFETDLLFMEDPTEDMLKAEVHESLQELVDWANMDFPAWLKVYLEDASEDSLISLKEVSQFWSEKQMYFGMFRIAAEIGIVTSRIPREATAIPPTHIEVGRKLSYTIKG